MLSLKKNDDGSFRLLYESQLHSRNLIVVYDSNTSTLDEHSPAYVCSKLIAMAGSKFSVKILSGGYEAFSRFYPFLRTQQTIYTPRELDELKTYPSEILPGLLYLGNKGQALQQYIKKDLKLKSYVDCTTTSENFKFKGEKSIEYFNLPVEDEPFANIKDYLDQVCQFIDVNVRNRKQPCLIFSELGVSRAAAVVIAYLVFSEKISVEQAIERVAKCKSVQPQVNFLNEIESHFAQT